MPRHNRNPKQARRAPFREQKPVILIVCEGEASEPEYLKGLRAACENPRVTIQIVPEHGKDPKTLVKIAKKAKQEAEQEAKRENDENLIIDSVWCVFDVDDHANIPDAVQMARDNEIHLAISNPSFELWLLLHFQDSPGMQGRDKMRKLLGNYLPDYDKHINYEENFAEGYDDAVRRGEKLNETAELLNKGHHEHNPSTGVYRLTESIREE